MGRLHEPMRLAPLLAMLVGGVGCHRTSDRERDCAEVRAILQPPGPTNPPRRHWDYSPAHKGSAALLDPSPLERLKQLSYRDAEVRDAALALASEITWTFYSPYSVEHQPASAADRLATLCGLPRTRIETE